MTVQNTQRLLHLTRQLTDTLVTAAWCANEISTLIQKQHLPDRIDHDAFAGNGSAVVERPLVDQSTFSVTWHGKSARFKKHALFLAALAAGTSAKAVCYPSRSHKRRLGGR